MSFRFYPQNKIWIHLTRNIKQKIYFDVAHHPGLLKRYVFDKSQIIGITRKHPIVKEEGVLDTQNELKSFWRGFETYVNRYELPITKHDSWRTINDIVL